MNLKVIASITIAVLVLSTGVLQAQEQKLENLKRVTRVLQYADGEAIESLLRPYLTKYGRVSFERGTRALTLVDDPPVVEIMLQLVNKFDQKLPQLQFSLKLVLAEKGDQPEPIPDNLKVIGKQLQEVFSYNRYSILDEAFVVAQANQYSSLKVGGDHGYQVELGTHLIEGEKNTINLDFHLYKTEWLKSVTTGSKAIRHTMIQTRVELRDGETAILGASKIDGDGKAVISVVTMKLK